MKWRAATSFSLLVGALCVGVARPSLAAEPSCPTLSVEVDAPLTARHPELAESVRQAFHARRDVDACSRVRLSARQSSIDVEVALPDGRSALRTAPRPEDVVPILEALLLVPSLPSSGNAPASAAPARRLSKAARPPVQRQLLPVSGAPGPDNGPVSTPSDSSSRLRIELSGALGVRAGDEQVGVALGLTSLLQISSWLVGFQARADQYQSSHDRLGALELSLLSGHRIDLEPFLLDFVAGPALSFQGFSTEGGVTRSTKVEGIDSAEKKEETVVTRSGVQTRAFLGTRLSFDTRSTFLAFLALDGDFALTRNSDATPGAPQLPAWTLGLSAGSTVGTP